MRACNLSSTAIVLLISSCCVAQEFDLLPDVQPSPYAMRAVTFASGLPVESEMQTEVFTQRVGPTDLAIIPGSTQIIVSNYGGTAIRFDERGNVVGTFLELANANSPTFNANFDVGGAHGFTSIAFHPDFSVDGSAGYGKFYTIESEKVDSGVPDFSDSTRSGKHHDDAVYEYTLPDALDVACGVECALSKREVVRVLQPGWHHNLGDLEFSSENLLFISSADGSTSQKTAPFMSDNAQTLKTIFGNILRIDPLGRNSSNGAYGIPDANPFVDDANVISEIYAYGFRNPYRLDFDTVSGELFTTDTGENAIESAYRVEEAGNHGWNLKEGSFLYDKATKTLLPDVDLDNSGVGDVAEAHDLVEPIFEYDQDFGRAIIGTVRYRDPQVPFLQDSLVFGDFSGRLFYGDLRSGDEFEFSLTEDSAPLPTMIHSVNHDADGGLYVLGIQRNGDDFDGVIVKLEACYGSSTPGDFNANGSVDFDDFLILSRNYAKEGMGYDEGDANCNGVIQFPDFLILSRGFSRARSESVPEPESYWMFYVVMFGVACRRQRRLNP